tara:strand:+ start:1442 stop:2653 length:1212 start_codon:yes stop_codon:yes gene_type:complete
MVSLKVGIVALHWPPDYGGAERYNSSLVDLLNKSGVEAWGLTPRKDEEGMDNGTQYVHRFGGHTNLEDSRGMKVFLNAALNHIESEAIHGRPYTHIIVSNCRKIGYPFKKFISEVQKEGVKVGTLHFDLDNMMRLHFEQMFKDLNDWDLVAQKMNEHIAGCFDYNSPLVNDDLGYWAIDSPLWFNPDFVISCSEWSNRFIDYKQNTPSFVFHPPLPKSPINKEKLEMVDITMINPMYHKGRSYMADIINDFNNKWTYRVLLGGYGGDKEDFLSMIADSWAVRDGRVDIVQYVERMEDVWDATKLFVFPSRFEGYGMAAVEPMMHGVPVMVQDYPSIREAVGDAAIVIPYGEDSREWLETIEELFFDDEEYDEYKAKGYEHILSLENREHEEVNNLIKFLEGLL